MKTMWTVLSVLALANLIAIGVLVGWLKSSDRLSQDRVQRIRTIFSQSVAQERAEEAAAKAQEERQERERLAEAEAARPPIATEQRLAIIREYEERRLQDALRTQRETSNLIQTLVTKQDKFEADKRVFDDEVAQFRREREEAARLDGDEQFQKSLKIYETVKAAEARSMLQTMLDEGKVLEVVAYLNAMKPRTASKIIAEFQKGDAVVAADLLERLRRYGVAVPPREAPSNADDASRDAVAAGAERAGAR